ncbi:hypothetical protein MBLNU13_g10986t1 [Cladosporium sp. NU13]
MNVQQLDDDVDSDDAGVDRPLATKNELTPNGIPPKVNTARKRHNSDDLKLDSGWETKRPQVTLTEFAEGKESEGQQHVLDPSNKVQKAVSAQDSHMPEKSASLE